MTAPTRILENPILKDRIILLETASETGGAYLRLQVELAPGGGVLQHFHTTFVERFEVTEGQLEIDLNGQHFSLQPGQVATAELGTVHRFYNTSPGNVIFITEVRPARQFEKNLRISYGLAREGKSNAQGLPHNPLYLAILFQYAETYLPPFPAWLQKAIMAPLWLVALLAGADRDLMRYL